MHNIKLFCPHYSKIINELTINRTYTFNNLFYSLGHGEYILIFTHDSKARLKKDALD